MLHSRFWQGFFALAPLVLFFIAIGAYMYFIFNLVFQVSALEQSEEMSPGLIFGNIGIFMLLIFLCVILSLGSLIFFIVHAVQNPNLKENNLLVVWILLFVFVSGIGQLIYWIVEILGKRKKPAVTDRTY